MLEGVSWDEYGQLIPARRLVRLSEQARNLSNNKKIRVDYVSGGSLLSSQCSSFAERPSSCFHLKGFSSVIAILISK
jgi:hypothetical protein